MPESQPQVTPERVMQFVWGFGPPLILEAAIHHRVFDVLDGGPRTVEQLSSDTGASQRGLRAICNALVSLGLLAKNDGCYSLTPESAAYLVSTRPTFQGGILRHCSRQLLPKWMGLTDIVRTGEPAAAVNREDTGGAFFHDFVEDIFAMSYASAQALGQALCVSTATQNVSVLDLAAGSGVWGIALAQRSPHVRVTAVDWPEVLPVTRRVTERMGVADRYCYVAGDLHVADFGTGHHIATLGHILHSEGEARSRALLRKVYDALAPGGTIAIGEFVPNEERTGPPPALIFAVNMLVNTDAGDTFTFGEISAWLQQAGFVEPRTVDAPGPSPLILARRPSA